MFCKIICVIIESFTNKLVLIHLLRMESQKGRTDIFGRLLDHLCLLCRFQKHIGVMQSFSWHISSMGCP